MPAWRSPKHTHDVFIAHASEDKEEVARPLVEALKERDWSAWLDEMELTVGDSLQTRIDEALYRSRFGVVILSPHFFAKAWTKRELGGLTALEVQSGTKVILPVWHNIQAGEVAEFSPTLADRVGVSTDAGIDEVADQLSRALTVAKGRPPAAGKEPVVQGFPALRAPRRRAPRAKPPAAPRRSYAAGRVFAIAVLVGITLLPLAMLLPADGSAGANREVHVGSASLEVRSASHVADTAAADRRLGLTSEIRGPDGAFLLGTVARDRLPAPGAGSTSVDVRLPAGRALRSDGVHALRAVRMFTFRLGNRYLMFVCRPLRGVSIENVRRACARAARSLELPVRSTAIPYPSASIRDEARSALGRFATGRRQAGEEMRQASTPEAVADAAARAAHSAEVAAGMVRSPRLAGIDKGLANAEEAWRTTAKAAREEDDKAYEKAGEDVASAERQLRKARKNLLGLGYQA